MKPQQTPPTDSLVASSALDEAVCVYQLPQLWLIYSPTAVDASAAVGAPIAPAGPGISSGTSSSAEGSPVPVNDSDVLMDSLVAVGALDNGDVGTSVQNVSGRQISRMGKDRLVKLLNYTDEQGRSISVPQLRAAHASEEALCGCVCRVAHG